MISNCGHDENGQYNNGAAGDQTGKEWQVIPWYNRPWRYVLRHPNAAVRSEIEKLARAAANNNNIGYDQTDRWTFWQQLKVSNYDPAQIKTKCEADCSSGVCGIVKAVGYRLGIEALKAVSSVLYTGNMRQALEDAGFQRLTESKYLISDKYLLPGDILLLEYAHTAINLDVGSCAEEGDTGWKAIGTATSAGDDVNVRSTPEDNGTGNIIGKLNKGNRFEVDGKVSGNWIHVKVAGIGIGYVYKDWVVYDAAWVAIGTATSAGDDVNVRSTPEDNGTGNIIGKLNKGNRFEVDGKVYGDWIHVKVAGIGIGYVHKDWVKYD